MAKIIQKEEMNSAQILEIAEALKNGKLIVFPTDTVYGIGTNAFDSVACEKIYQAKNRPKHKPLLVLISDISMLKEMVNEISLTEQKLMAHFWPGSLTIKFKKKNKILPDIISANDDYVRVRMIKEGVIFKIIQTAKIPIVAPSANLSGSLTGTKIENIKRELEDKVDYILDYGDIESDITSTIVQVEKEEIMILREGKITKEELAEIAPIKEEDMEL